jgi:xanthine dehydrogenase small subunit
MTSKISFVLNNESITEEINPAITVLDYLRGNKKLTGTKEGCREGDCGACTIIIGTLEKNKINYKTVNSCLMPVADLNGKHIVTIEGLNENGLNAVQENMVDEGGTQCGFCTPGFIMSITNYFLTHSEYSLNEAVDALDGNICRCTGYEGIKRSIHNVIETLEAKENNSSRDLKYLIDHKIIPQYFVSVPKLLKNLHKDFNESKNPKRKVKTNYLVSGGTDLYVQRWDELYSSKINFIQSLNASENIVRLRNRLIIKGATTIEEFKKSEIIYKHFPQLRESLKLFGSMPIRNRATIAGNIVNASPIADAANILLALNAVVIAVTKNKKRKIPLDEFYIGYKKTKLNPGEIIDAVEIEIPKKGFLFNYEKVSRRMYLDIASVNSSILIELKKDTIINARLSAGGVAPVPLLLSKTSSFLIGRRIDDETISEASKIAASEISPISDTRGSKKYKTLLLQKLIIAHFVKLFPELNNSGAQI